MDERDTPATIHCTIAGPDGLATAVAGAGDFAEREGLSAGDTARLAVIVEELVANLFDHAGLSSGGQAELSITRCDGSVDLLLEDDCARFDPATGIRRPEHEVRGGGVGLELVRAWAEAIDYRSEAGRNRLSLRLPLRG